jgi:hypothetical protein
MRKVVLGLAAVAGVAMCSGAHADSYGVSGPGDGFVSDGSITVDGLLGDWGVATPGVSNDFASDGPGLVSNVDWFSTEGAYVYEDKDDRPGPGIGGQNFDAEALYTGYDASTNTLYVGLITGFDILGETSGASYFAGDLFIDFGNDYDQTGRTGGDSFTEVPYDNTAGDSRWDLAFVLGRDGVYGGNVADASSTSVDVVGAPNFTYAETPAAAGFHSGPLSATSGDTLGSADFGYTNNWGGGDHNVYEFGYTLTGPQGLAWQNQILAGGWTAHWTMSCGNDFLDVGTSLPSGTTLTPVVPVPAAAPMVLLGMGIVGALRRNRKKSN